MAVRNRARTEQEFIYLINQALDEVFDLRAAIEYDEEFMDNAALIVDPLQEGLSQLLNAVKTGEYTPGKDKHIEFLNVLKNTDHRAIPFWSLLKLILDTHTEGYQGEE